MDQPIPPTTPTANLPLGEGVPEADAAQHEPAGRMSRNRFNLKGRTLRQHAARGMLINTGFMVGLSGLGFVKGFILAAFLSAEDYGIWGILAVALGTLLWLKQFGVGDKFIQQDEQDQEVAFQKAFSLELASTGVFVVLLSALLPLVAAAYGQPDLLLPGYVIILLILPTGILRAPLWVFYRQMEFFKQRALQSVDPVVSLLVSIALAIAGFGYWAFVIGMLAGAWAAAAMALAFSPYRLRLRWDRATLREYWSFSWPLFITGAGSLVIAQSATFATEARLGVAAVGALALASSITALTQRVDSLVTGTLYPAICAVKDRVDLLHESFVKSNRLALMWGVPFGFGLALFASDLVSYGIGEKWRPAVELLQIYGITAAINQVGFNWDAYFRARAETRPMAVASVIAAGTFLAVGLPLLFLFELRGLAIGVAAQALAHLCVRAYYLSRLFEGFRILRHAARGVLPAVPATAVVLALRLAGPFDRSLGVAFAEVAVYGLVTVAVTWRYERGLLREMVGYLARDHKPHQFAA